MAAARKLEMMDATAVSDLFTNPWVWVGLLVALVGAVFALGQWKGRVDADRASFKELMKEVRDDIKEILRRLPSQHAGS